MAEKSPMQFVGPSHMWPIIHFPKKAPGVMHPRIHISWKVMLIIILVMWMGCVVLIPPAPIKHDRPPLSPELDRVALAKLQNAGPAPTPVVFKPKATAYLVYMKTIIAKHGQAKHPLPISLADGSRKDRN